MSFTDTWYKKALEEFYTHVRPEYKALAERERKIDWEEFSSIRMNSYEQKLIVQNLDDDALCKFYEQCLKHSKRALGALELPRHYDDIIQLELAPLLVERLRARLNKEIA